MSQREGRRRDSKGSRDLFCSETLAIVHQFVASKGASSTLKNTILCTSVFHVNHRGIGLEA